MAESIYRQDYLHERLQLWVDNLNLLYVAFTRAGKNLILWSRKEQKGTISELLASTLPHIAEDGAGSWDEEASIYENGRFALPPVPVSQHDADNPANDEAKPLYYEQKPLYCERKPEVYEQQPVNRLSQKPVKLPVHMESMLHDIEFRQSNRSADFIAGVDEAESSQRFIKPGDDLLHTLFSAIENGRRH